MRHARRGGHTVDVLNVPWSRERPSAYGRRPSAASRPPWRCRPGRPRRTRRSRHPVLLKAVQLSGPRDRHDPGLLREHHPRAICAGVEALRAATSRRRSTRARFAPRRRNTGHCCGSRSRPTASSGRSCHRRLRIEYDSPRESCPRDLVVDPYGLFAKAGIWYLVADCAPVSRMYRLERITTWKEVDQP
ncbi:WYL domain-containing protein [Streptomyces sp. NPDC002740]